MLPPGMKMYLGISLLMSSFGVEDAEVGFAAVVGVITAGGRR
jgi:hypothetical protein